MSDAIFIFFVVSAMLTGVLVAIYSDAFGTGRRHGSWNQYSNDYKFRFTIWAYNRGFYSTDQREEEVRRKHFAKQAAREARIQRNEERYKSMIFNKQNPDK